MATKAFDNQTTDGVSPDYDFASDTTIDFRGTFHSAIIYIEISDDAGATWSPRATFVNPSAFILELTGTWKFRFRIANAGSQTSITVVFDA